MYICYFHIKWGVPRHKPFGPIKHPETIIQRLEQIEKTDDKNVKYIQTGTYDNYTSEQFNNMGTYETIKSLYENHEKQPEGKNTNTVHNGFGKKVIRTRQ